MGLSSSLKSIKIGFAYIYKNRNKCRKNCRIGVSFRYITSSIRTLFMEQIFISEAAQAHFRKLLDTQEEGTNIRIFVVNPGTPGAECGVSYCPPNSVEATDTEMKYDTFSAFVDRNQFYRF